MREGRNERRNVGGKAWEKWEERRKMREAIHERRYVGGDV